jgi:hypothetical protein
MSETATVTVPASPRLERGTVALIAAVAVADVVASVGLGNAIGDITGHCGDLIEGGTTPPQDLPFLCTARGEWVIEGAFVLLRVLALPFVMAVDSIVGSDMLAAIPRPLATAVFWAVWLANGIVLGVIAAGLRAALRRRSAGGAGGTRGGV